MVSGSLECAITLFAFPTSIAKFVTRTHVRYNQEKMKPRGPSDGETNERRNAHLRVVPELANDAGDDDAIDTCFAPAPEDIPRLLASRTHAHIDLRFSDGAVPIGSIEYIVHRMLPDRAAIAFVDGPIFKVTFALLPEEVGIEQQVLAALMQELPNTTLEKIAVGEATVPKWLSDLALTDTVTLSVVDKED